MDAWRGGLMFPSIYEDTPCPMDGYEGYTFRILANPTQQVKIDWVLGNLGDPSCPECQKLNGPARGKPKADEPPTARRHCERHSQARMQFARAAIAIYGTSKVSGFDFSDEAAALASFDQDMPDEFLTWLYMAPGALWEQRAETLKKRVLTPSSSVST
jgi:hypothetical protein